MVTASGLRAVTVSGAALGGMFLGFYVQDRVKASRMARIEAKVEEEVARRKAALFSGLPRPDLVDGQQAGVSEATLR